MRSLAFVAVVTAILGSAGGCRMFRAIDQWKCDNLGCCMFGTTPSPYSRFAPPPVCVAPCDPCDPCGAAASPCDCD